MTTDEPQTREPIESTEDESLETSNGAEEPSTPEEAKYAPSKQATYQMNAIRILWIVIGGLTLLLILSMISNRSQTLAAVPVNDPDVAALQADVEMQRAEINRQRAELNLPALAGRGEDLDAITARLRKDADTLILLIERSHQLIAEKDRLLTEKNLELIRSEQIRESLSSELARAQSNSAGNTGLENDLSDALARANRLADELGDARKLIAELSEDTSTAEIDTLKRQRDEAIRARDFFELRVQQLQATRQNRRDPNGEDGEEE